MILMLAVERCVTGFKDATRCLMKCILLFRAASSHPAQSDVCHNPSIPYTWRRCPWKQLFAATVKCLQSAHLSLATGPQ